MLVGQKGPLLEDFSPRFDGSDEHWQYVRLARLNLETTASPAAVIPPVVTSPRRGGA